MSEGGSTHGWVEGEIVAGKYVLLRPLAKGGMGSVWVAQNQMTERKVAIKFMLPELAENPDVIQRFFREAKASARIDHPSIVDVLDLGTLPDGAPFLVMEFLEGRPLDKIIDGGLLTPVQAAAIMLDVTRALTAAHAAGIVHRDLKPANIYVAKRGDLILPKILDFGISKITSQIGNDIRMTRTGAVLGSPAYMSPEQARGRSDLDGRTDIWAIGVILYECVSQRIPFNGENYNQVMMAITLEDPPPLAQVAPQVDPEFVAIVDQCLRKDRDHRPPTMEALSALLDGYVAPRAAYGIPPIDIGDPVSARNARIGSTYRLASNGGNGGNGGNGSARMASGSPPAAPRPEHASTTVRSDPSHMTVGAVTVIETPKKRGRGALVAVSAILLAGVVGVGAWAVVGQRARDGERSPPATEANTTETETTKPAPKKSVDPPTKIDLPDPIDTTVPIGTAKEPASAEPSTAPLPSATTSMAPATKASTPANPTVPTVVTPKPKPQFVPKPSSTASTKPSAKPSAKPSSENDGPASVGTGPGF